MNITDRLSQALHRYKRAQADRDAHQVEYERMIERAHQVNDEMASAIRELQEALYDLPDPLE